MMNTGAQVWPETNLRLHLQIRSATSLVRFPGDVVCSVAAGTTLAITLQTLTNDFANCRIEFAIGRSRGIINVVTAADIYHDLPKHFTNVGCMRIAYNI